MALKTRELWYWAHIWNLTSYLKSASSITLHVPFNSHLDSLWGHSGLHWGSEIKFDIRFQTDNLSYPAIHVHINPYSHLCGLWGHGSLLMISEVASNIKFELSGLNNPCYHASLSIYKLFFDKVSTDVRHHTTSFIPLILPVPSIDSLDPEGARS